jgi:hypothetical protein
MNTNRNLFFIAVVGVIAPWFLSTGPSQKKSPEVSVASNDRAVEPRRTDASDSRQLLWSNSAPQSSQALSLTNLNSENPPIESDPEKIALQINSMGENEVRQWLALLSSEELTGNTGHLLIRRWMQLDPTAAASWVSLIGDAGAQQQLVDTAAVAWSENDLPAALTWVESLPYGAVKTQALTDLGYELARTDPVKAMLIAAQLPAGLDTDGFTLHSLAQFASADPVESQQLALSLPLGTLRDNALTTVAAVQAQYDGPSAARFIAENIPPGPALDRGVISVVQLWSQSSLPDASAWVSSFPESPLRNQALQSLR